MLSKWIHQHPGSQIPRKVFWLGNCRQGQNLLAVVQGASSCQCVTEGSQSSPLLQALLPFGRAAYFQGFRFCPRDHELLQFLANFRRQAKVLDDVLGNWLLPVFRTLRCLFQRWLRQPFDVPGPIEPRSPTEAAHLSEPMRHQAL